MRKPLIAGNWKMNKTKGEAADLIRSLKDKVESVDKADIMVAPPYTALDEASKCVRGSKIFLAAQNMHHEASGAYTGEISAGMLKEIGCDSVIIGHSERRQYFGCTDELVNKKLKAAIHSSLKPVVCIGESLEERENEETFDVLKKQLSVGFSGLTSKEWSAVTVAYEPVWAIGTGKTATPEQAEEAHKFVRETISELSSGETAEKIRILYGGSMKPANAGSLLEKKNVDGGLVGGASLDADSFYSIIKEAAEK